MAELAILVPAAGLSRRMRGADKLLEPVDGEAMLRRQARMALGLEARVLVTLPPGAARRRAALAGLALDVIEVADAREGMAASLRAGAAALARGARDLMILPADMPELTRRDLRDVVVAFEAAGGGVIMRATAADGRPGHPVLFPRRLVPEFATLRGDTGAAAILSAHPGLVSYHALPDERALTDLDTPEAWAAWRARE